MVSYDPLWITLVKKKMKKKAFQKHIRLAWDTQ